MSSPSLATIRQSLASIQQEHLLTFFERLDATKQARLLANIASMNLGAIPGLVREYVLTKPAAHGDSELSPPAYYPADCTSTAGRGAWDRAHFRAKGIELIAGGQVAAFTVAGGQGSRLGFEGPKGCYPAGAVSNIPLFACLADWIIAAQRAFCPAGVRIPWYIKTSPLYVAQTREFCKLKAYLGLDRHHVMFFPQGVMPSFDITTGKILLSDLHEPAVNPDGHGGSIRALMVSGAIADMKRRGVRHISYTQIDNPLVRVIDPVFLGLHSFAPDSSAQMSSKMVAKAHAGEKVGVLARMGAGGKIGVVEYSDMPRALTEAVDASGRLVFNAGNAAVHVLSVEFVERLNGGGGGGGGAGGQGASMPYHRAEKKVPHVDLTTGQRVEPTSNNAVKLETFVFDALAMCESSIVMESLRVDEFAPIKNATAPGVSDSPQTCREIQTARAAAWLERAGVRVPRKATGEPDCVLELPPSTAMDMESLIAQGPAMDIVAGAKIVV
ncbi:MAG: UTP--glucose-1-phosphate uridylyltransferase [Phycisphaerales bacterium]|nr:UTP--glucose-1-phosphate uridylyltransferase [Phycisphaerales bacterium]